MAGAGNVKYGPADSATQQRAQLPSPPVPAKCCDLVGTGQTTLGFLNLDFDTMEAIYDILSKKVFQVSKLFGKDNLFLFKHLFLDKDMLQYL